MLDPFLPTCPKSLNYNYIILEMKEKEMSKGG